MTISGFTFIKNARIYDFQVVESVRSVLPLVDEMIIVAGDSDDDTDEILATITSPKIRIIKSVWDRSKFSGGAKIYAEQTDIALRECNGDWCVYIQSDEVLHEDGIEPIRAACQKYLSDKRVDGFTLDFVHIYGDYKHYISARHFGYPREIRIVRGGVADIHSWRDAQSFRYMPDFDGVSYGREDNTRKLCCVKLSAKMFHYGWSRNPVAMFGKANMSRKLYNENATLIEGRDYYDYGNVDAFPLYKGSQPLLMTPRIENMDWGNLLRYTGEPIFEPKIFGAKYRIINFIENKILGHGRRIGGFKNYKLLK